MDKPTLKIFISSPGDVLYERQIAKRIIAKLGKEFASSTKLEALLWEDMPLQVTASFQEGIDRIVNANMVDIAIFILWSRLGTPLSDKFVKPDGGFYKSGTEYEFEMMYAANQQSGVPSILAYIKNAPITDVLIQTKASGDFDFEEIGKQHKEAQRFIREKFYDPDTKTVYGAYHQFEAPTSFEQKLTEHLRRLIIHKIGHEAILIEWEGNPYVGLRAFRYDENAIFYGRRQTINSLEEKLTRWLPDKAPCLFVLGESGSGKSSLVRAGLLPDMIEFGWVENTKWKWFDVMPNQFRGNIYNGLLSKLSEAFPVLNEKAIGKDLMMGKEVNFDHLSDILPNNTNEAVLFFIDQFEEIFTDPLITEEERIRTFALLRGMAATHKIWMIFSMRSDFYHKFTAYPHLSELKNNSIIYDLPKILHSELQEIIEEPARKAGLKWETNEKGIALNRTIIHDINTGVDDLPLIEFALSELYNLRDENNVLNCKAYEEIGKINGAVVKYVDNFYNTLTEKEKEFFYQLLSSLIAPSVENKNLYVRKTAQLKDLQKTELHKQLIDKLINSHILISGKGENGEATVSIVHEILITSWKVIQDWIKQEKYFIDSNNHYENLSKYWTERKKTKNDLLQGTEAIKESEYFMFSWGNNCSTQVKDFVLTSIKRKKRMFFPWILFLLSIGGIVGIAKFAMSISEHKTPTLIDVFTYLILICILAYAAWKRKKALPVFYTINVSLVVWSIAFGMSIFIMYLGDSAEGYFIFPLLVSLKLILTIFQKREILQWKQRIFKRGFNLVSVFLDKSSKSFQKALRLLAWVVLVIMIACIVVGGIFISTLMKVNERFEAAQLTIEELFKELDNISALSASDRLFILKKRAAYLRENFFDEKPIKFTGNSDYRGWSAGKYYSAGKNYFDYAYYQYNLGHPEDFITGINQFFKTKNFPSYPHTAIKAAFELGLFDDCRKLLESHKDYLKSNKGRPSLDNEVVWTAEKVGLFDLAKEILDSLDNNGALVIYKAHALLMTGESEKALSLYRQQINDTSFDLKKDFAVFRWLGFSDTELSMAEKELHLDRINVFTHPDDEANTAIATPFTGKWQYEESDYHRILWEITADNHNLCRYVFQTKKNNWVDDSIAVTRFRFKQMDSKTIIEEYNVRTNTLTVSEVTLISNDEMHVKTIDNAEIKVFRRLK